MRCCFRNHPPPHDLWKYRLLPLICWFLPFPQTTNPMSSSLVVKTPLKNSATVDQLLLSCQTLTFLELRSTALVWRRWYRFYSSISLWGAAKYDLHLVLLAILRQSHRWWLDKTFPYYYSEGAFRGGTSANSASLITEFGARFAPMRMNYVSNANLWVKNHFHC